MKLDDVVRWARQVAADILAPPALPGLPVFTPDEWASKWRRYVEMTGREIVRSAERAYLFEATICGPMHGPGGHVRMTLTPVILRPPIRMVRGVLPVPARPPFGTLGQMDALCAALNIKVHEMIYVLDSVEPFAGMQGAPPANYDNGDETIN